MLSATLNKKCFSPKISITCSNSGIETCVVMMSSYRGDQRYSRDIIGHSLFVVSKLETAWVIQLLIVAIVRVDLLSKPWKPNYSYNTT